MTRRWKARFKPEGGVGFSAFMQDLGEVSIKVKILWNKIMKSQKRTKDPYGSFKFMNKIEAKI